MSNLLKDYTTLGIGGPAQDIITVTTVEDLKSSIINHKSYLVIGGGSNLLVSDEGLDKVIIKNEIKGIEQSGTVLKVKSGTVLQDLVNDSIARGLSGLQKLTGIPGTVGGAVYGNAGAYGQTISDHLTSVKCVIPSNEGIQLTTLTKEQCNFSYRDSEFKKTKQIILEVEFELSEGNSENLKKEADETLEKRLIKYPQGIKCPGSFFKNIIADSLPKEILEKIPKDKIMYGKIPAGSLLEELGAKGDSEGQIKIASYHANLFINLGNGTAKDFYILAKKYYEKVKQKYGISLEPEVQLINLPPLDQI